jgi:Uncharacterized protein conserved in bacteria (DUF2188)
MPANSRDVVPDGEGGWRIERPGAARSSGNFPTQQEAIQRGHEILHNAGGGELRIHGRDGQIRDARTVPPGHDPFPPRDKR